MIGPVDVFLAANMLWKLRDPERSYGKKAEHQRTDVLKKEISDFTFQRNLLQKTSFVAIGWSKVLASLNTCGVGKYLPSSALLNLTNEITTREKELSLHSKQVRVSALKRAATRAGIYVAIFHVVLPFIIMPKLGRYLGDSFAEACNQGKGDPQMCEIARVCASTAEICSKPLSVDLEAPQNPDVEEKVSYLAGVVEQLTDRGVHWERGLKSSHNPEVLEFCKDLSWLFPSAVECSISKEEGYNTWIRPLLQSDHSEKLCKELLRDLHPDRVRGTMPDEMMEQAKKAYLFAKQYCPIR